ncbi:hypothetical protein NG796_12050 [Laspinema sp. A4]|uniref:hypothetical protein n=1 Tax=Laspinema sp. D2d TaxID=2953686 RepID=UPI0021BA6206|nr:hypothetical protein [Laspinema sp. D2d]MCT7984030.1 hypothetical protein [Laspinema sp. D2d]
MIEQLSGELLHYPKFSLYAFHLCHDMALAEGQRVEDADVLWQRFEELGESLDILALKTCRQWLNIPEQQAAIAFRELLSEEIDRCLRFHFPEVEGKSDTPRRNGELYAVQLHDTYVADLTFRYPGIVPVAELTHLNPEGMLLPDRICASIGQTLVLFAKPVIAEESPSPDTLRQLADRCLQALLTNATLPILPSYRAEGKLLSSPIFEYDNDAENPAQSCHILIWLDCHPDTAKLEASTKYYHPLMNLLCCRSKIRLSYHQARTSYRDCRQLYTELETLMKALKTLPDDTAEKLTVLQEALLKINPQAFSYASHIRDIEDQRTTIITNLKNYTTTLEELTNIDGEQELSFLQAFSYECRSKLLGQIHTNLNYLKPGQALFGHCIATMRGIVEVEQAKMNHNQQQENQDLQDQIQAVGVGIAAGAIVASTSGLMFQPWEWKGEKVEPSFPLPLLAFLIALFFSAACSVGAWYWAKEGIKQGRFPFRDVKERPSEKPKR